MTAIVGICCLRMGRPGAAGALLALSALLRVFPAAILATLGLRAAMGMWRRRRVALTSADRRLALGAVLAVVTVVPLSFVTYGGVDPWFEFVDNSRLHLATPLKNNVGLPTLLAFDPASVDRRLKGGNEVKRYERWRDARKARLEEREWIRWTALIAYLALLALAVRTEPEWVAAVLGIGAIPFAFELTNYYYAILLGFGLLSVRREGIGASLCGISALSWAIVEHWQWRDEIMTWCSVMVLVYVFGCTAISAARRVEA